MGVCAAVAAISSAVIAGGAAIHQGEVQSNYAQYQKDQAQADANAKREAAMVRAEQIRKSAKAQKARAVAALAGSGVNVDSGTALNINQTIDKNAEQDAFLTIVGGNDSALRLESAAHGYGTQAANDKTAGYINAGTTLLGATTNNGKGWKKAS